MQITNCKLSKRAQKKLLEFFVLEVTARSAAENGHTLTAEEQTTLLAQLVKLRVQRNPGCQTALDNFIGRTAK